MRELDDIYIWLSVGFICIHDVSAESNHNKLKTISQMDLSGVRELDDIYIWLSVGYSYIHEVSAQSNHKKLKTISQMDLSGVRELDDIYIWLSIGYICIQSALSILKKLRSCKSDYFFPSFLFFLFKLSKMKFKRSPSLLKEKI